MYKYMYSDNNGNEEIVSFENEKEMYENINEIMQDIYDNLCAAYEDKDVTWLNRLFDVSKVTEIYVPDTNISYNITILDVDEYHPISTEAVYTCDNIAKIFDEQDRWRKASPCCQNCKEYYEEYGTEFCKKHDYPCEDTKETCEDWR